MNYIISEQGLGIVILGTFAPQLFDINNLVEIGVIKHEEEEQSRMITSNPDQTLLTVRNIRVMCDRFRLQIVTIDTIVIPRLMEFCRDVINTMNVDTYRGVGINTHLKIRFAAEADLNIFRQRLLPSQAEWMPISRNGHFENVSIRNENRTIELQCKEEDGNLSYSFNINIHYAFHNLGEIIDIVGGAQTSFDNEIGYLNRFLSDL